MKLLNQIIEKMKIKKNSEEADKKIPLILLLFIFGVIFLVFPSEKKTENKVSNSELDIISYRENEEKRLNNILSSVLGVKEAEIFINYSDNGYIEVLNEERTVMKKNSNSLNEMQTEKNPVYNNDKNTVVKKRHLPTVAGVCIFYKGDDDKKTRDRLFRAAKSALGTESHKIEIVLIK